MQDPGLKCWLALCGVSFDRSLISIKVLSCFESFALISDLKLGVQLNDFFITIC